MWLGEVHGEYTVATTYHLLCSSELSRNLMIYGLKFGNFKFKRGSNSFSGSRIMVG